MSRRPDRSVRVRPDDLGRAQADERSVCRPAAGVVARRPPHRVRHRSVLVASGALEYRSVPARPDRSGRTGPSQQVARFHERQEHQPAVGARQRAIYFLSRSRRHLEPVPRRRSPGRSRSSPPSCTGLSGITSTSPAMSVASRTGTSPFSVYDRGAYDIYSAGPPPRWRAAGVTSWRARRRCSPRSIARPSTVAALLADAASGLPPAHRTPTVEDYTPKLALEAVGQPSVAVGADRFGAAIAGGIAFYFSDMLGDQSLIVAVTDQLGLHRRLQPQGHRGAGRVPERAAPLELGRHRRTGAVRERRLPRRDRTIHERAGPTSRRRSSSARRETSVAGLVAYPFNRAQRIEFQGGVTHSRRSTDRPTQAVSLRTEDLIWTTP